MTIYLEKKPEAGKRLSKTFLKIEMTII